MPYIRISCFADLGVIVSVNLEGGTFDEWVNYDTTRVRLRFDGGEVISRTPKLNDSRDSAYFWNAESEIVGLFLDHDTALVEVTPFNTSPSAIEFDLHGLREAMQQTAPDCFADFL